MKIVVATKNAHKVKELSDMLALDGLSLVTLSDMGFTGEIEENGSTFAENALIKARTAARLYGLPALADDSGLCVDALDGEPGIYSARYASTDGENASDAANVEKLLEKLKSIPSGERTLCLCNRTCNSGRFGKSCDRRLRGCYYKRSPR